jgi:nitrogen regulatory protein P-II 1
MKKIEMIIRPEKLEDVKEILNSQHVFGLTVTMVSGCGHQKGRKEMYRGTEINMNLLPKIKVETVVKDNIVNDLIKMITSKVKTGAVGDGKIFIYNVEEAVRIRTNESGDDAL